MVLEEQRVAPGTTALLATPVALARLRVRPYYAREGALEVSVLLSTHSITDGK